MVNAVLNGRRYVARFEAEQKSAVQETRGDHGFGGHEYTVHWWDGGGKIIDKRTGKSRICRFATSSTESALQPLEESVIVLDNQRGDAEETIKDRKGVIDVCLKKMLDKIEEEGPKEKWPLPLVCPPKLDVDALRDLNLMESTAEIEELDQGKRITTEIVVPFKALLVSPDEVAVKHSISSFNMSIEELASSIVDSLRIETEQEGDSYSTRVYGIATKGWKRSEFEMSKFYTQGVSDNHDAGFLLRLHRTVVEQMYSNIASGRKKYLELRQKQNEEFVKNCLMRERRNGKIISRQSNNHPK